jgi:pyrroline-5-carboxylate reductase
MKICFIGTGRMGEALIRGVLKADLLKPNQIYASDVDEGKTKKLSRELGIHKANNIEVIKKSDVVVLAVKPKIVKQVLKEVKNSASRDQLFISIAAGVQIASLEEELPNARFIRVMPNIACTVGSAASAFCPGKNAREEDRKTVKAIFGAVGRIVEVPENLMDAVTGLSGSGPAFIFMVIEALADAGVYEGMDRKTALELATQTVLGAAKMVLETGKHPAELKDMVTSPGGTTIRGLDVLEKKGVRSAFISAVKEATKRSKEIARGK